MVIIHEEKTRKKAINRVFFSKIQNSDEILECFFPRMPRRVYFSEQILKLTKEII